MSPTARTYYRVSLAVPGGDAVLDVPTFQGPDAAERRAFWTAVAAGWGDVDEVFVVSSEPAPLDELEQVSA